LVVASGLTGCAASRPNATHDAAKRESSRLGVSYRLRPGDEIEIRSFYTPELNATAVIRPDGQISLDAIGAMHAAGLTVDELDSAITARYSRFLVDPDLTVAVRQFSGQKIFVGGEVAQPGLLVYDESLTVLRAIIQAGGVKNSAKLNNVLLLRDSGHSETLMMKVNLKEVIEKGKLDRDPRLKPFDVVFVPRSSVSKMNQFVAQYVEGLLPLGTVSGFLWTYRLITRGF